MCSLLVLISVLMSSKTTFFPILSDRASSWFAIVSRKSFLLFLRTVITALTFVFAGFSTARVTTSSLIVATGDRTGVLEGEGKFAVLAGEKIGVEEKKLLLCFKNLGSGSREDL